jgi:hypothetical protein
MALADLGADGRLDLVLGNTQPAGFTVLLGDGAGGFRALSTRSLGGHSAFTDARDLDADGRIDLAVAVDRVVMILPGNGDGSFAAGRDHSLPAPSRHLAAGDPNSGRNTRPPRRELGIEHDVGALRRRRGRLAGS